MKTRKLQNSKFIRQETTQPYTPITGPDCGHVMGGVACSPHHLESRSRTRRTSGRLVCEMSACVTAAKPRTSPLCGLGSGGSVVSDCELGSVSGSDNTRYWSSVVSIEDNQSVNARSNANRMRSEPGGSHLGRVKLLSASVKRCSAL